MSFNDYRRDILTITEVDNIDIFLDMEKGRHKKLKL